jgi:hypothetical protein
MEIITRFIKFISSSIFAIALLIIIYFLVPGVKESSPVNKYRGNMGEPTEYNTARGAERGGYEEASENIKQQSTPEVKENVGASTEYFITSDEIALIYELSNRDRLAVMAILDKLWIDDKQKISKILQNGITKNEFNSLRTILEKRLGEEDIAVLVEIVNRNKKNKKELGNIPE